ncbi:MAG: hypothetical protein SNJ70_09455 [Armatimonadota bacterium]
MELNAALLSAGNVNFAIVEVKPHIIQHTIMADATISKYKPLFPKMVVILMTRDKNGKALYYGREDIVRFLSGVDINSIPFKKYTAIRAA